MKKLIALILISCVFLFSLSTISMDPISDKYKLVYFRADDGTVGIEKQNIPLIGALYERYDLYLKSKYKGHNIPIPLLPGTAKKENIRLINTALNARPDAFAGYFYKLDKDKQDELLKLSMLFCDGNKKIGLCVPEITKRLLKIYWHKADDIYSRVMALVDNKEKNDLIYYCKEQLIARKNPVGILKQPILFEMWEEIDLQSLFMNAYFCFDTIKQPIPLRVANDTYKTYAYNFVSKQCEYRVTAPKKQNYSSDYLLWVINHKNPNATVVAPIHHVSPIIGCCFSKTKSDIEYVITYSENDIIFSKIMMFEDGFSDIHSIHVNTAEKGKNVVAAYCNANGRLYMGMYRGIDNIIRVWNIDGTMADKSMRFPFKRFGLLEKILITPNKAFFVFGACGLYQVQKFRDLTNASWTYSSYTTLGSTSNRNVVQLVEQNGEIFIYDHLYSPFASIEAAKEKKNQSSFWQGLRDDFCFEPDDECYSTYYQSGEFLLRNSLKKEFGLLYVTTQILDPITHNQLLSIDTLYKNFAAVGFDHEGKKLIFHHNNISNAQVFLWDEKDKEVMNLFEQCALQNLGTTSLMARLLDEVKKNGYITLKETDPVCKMLRDCTKERPQLRTFMEKYFPLIIVKA